MSRAPTLRRGGTVGYGLTHRRDRRHKIDLSHGAT